MELRTVKFFGEKEMKIDKVILSKNNIVYILKFGVQTILFCVLQCILLLQWNNLWGDLFSNKFDYSKKIDIVCNSGVEDLGNYYCTISDDPWLILEVPKNGEVVFDLKIKETKMLDGQVYFSNTIDGFAEENSQKYTYLNGTNYILVNDKNVKFIRLDITNEKGVEFSISNVFLETPIHYLIKNNIFNIITTAILLALLFNCIKLAVKNPSQCCFLFWIIMIISLFIIYRYMLLGKAIFMYQDIGTDTMRQYYPYYINIIEQIRSGDFPFWNWNYGLGTSILNVTSWTFDPFSILVILFGVLFGTDTVAFILVYVQVLKILILFFISKKYLKYFSNNCFAVCLSAYLISLNAYIMTWGQHYFLGTACVFFTLLLLCIERFIKKSTIKNGIYISITIGILLMYSYYTGYMSLLVAAIYFLFRFFSYNKEIKFNQIVKNWGGIIYFVVLGIMLAGVIFIPACHYITTNSVRLDNNTNQLVKRLIYSFGQSFNFSDLGSRLSRLLSNNILFINDNNTAYFSNYYETPQLFCTTFVFFFFGQWIVYKIINIKNKRNLIFFLIKITLFYLLIFNSLSGFILNAFAYSAYRYTFVIFPFIGIFMLNTIERIYKKEISKLGILIGFILNTVTIYFSYKNASNEVIEYVGIVFTILIIYTVLIIMAKCKQNITPVVFIFLIIILSTILDDSITTNYRSYITIDQYRSIWAENRRVSDTEKALKWLEEYDSSFYRVEKNYINWALYADSFLERYSTITVYNSTPNYNVESFYKKIYNTVDMSAVTDFRLNNAFDLKALSLVNSKYILSSDKLLYSIGLEKIKEFGSVTIYKNSNTDSVAKWFNATISKKEFESLSEEQKVESLNKTIVTDMINMQNESSSKIYKFYLEDSSTMMGSISCDGEGILMLAIPDQEGWTVYVDGNKVTTYNVDYGFIGVKISKGVHKIKACYEIPQLNIGILCTLLAVVQIFFLLIKENIQKMFADISK